MITSLFGNSPFLICLIHLIPINSRVAPVPFTPKVPEIASSLYPFSGQFPDSTLSFLPNFIPSAVNQRVKATYIPLSQTETAKFALTSLGYSTMNALRSSSALARRSLATPPAPLSSTSRLISSSSFTSSSKRSISSTSLSQRTNRVVASSRWSGSISSSITQTRTMASENKIKVKTPLVELDGDEVWETLSFYSSNFESACFTSPHILVLARAFSSKTRGNTGNSR